jgi:4-amino-4-deoxy-L-arabinose transferase-like glycosyltransferase
MAAVGLLVRLLYLALGHPWRFTPGEDHFHFGWEMGRIAAALATGRGYADPFVRGTGPTAWEPPLYPWILALVFKLCGTYSALSGFAILAFNSLCNCVLIVPLVSIARLCCSRRAALWAGWAWALYPAAMQYAVRWVWEMSMTACLFTAIMLLTLRLGGMGAPGRRLRLRLWLAWGLLWGLLALANPTLGLALPVCGAWLFLRGRAMPAKEHHDWRSQVRGATLAALVCLATLAPWIARNWVTFHQFIPVRDNFGAEVWAGDGPGSDGFRAGNLLPLNATAAQTLLYQRMGEPAWVHMRGQQAYAFLRRHPGHLLRLSLKRLYFQWFGLPHPSSTHPAGEALRSIDYALFSLTGWLGLALSFRRGVPGSGLFLGIFLVTPIFCYLVSAGPGFRHPLEPLIDIFTVYLFQSARRSGPPAEAA